MSTLSPPGTPVRYHDHIETPEKNEAEVIAKLGETMLEISRKTFESSGHARRSVHVKSHGILRGTLSVLPGLPAELAQGIFAVSADYPVIMRFSTPPGDVLPDRVSLPRAVAIKVSEVTGERLPQSGDSTGQDFLAVNGPAFDTPDAKGFLANLKLLAATTERAPGAKVVGSAILRGVEKVIEAVGGESGKIKALGGHPETHILGEQFFTQVPVRYGDYIAKFTFVPVSPGLLALKDAPVDLSDDYALRKAVQHFFAAEGAEWEVRVQLCTDLEQMPIEDASVVWPEDLSPFRAVARIRMEAQDSWNEDAGSTQDRLAFSPWNGVTAHRPLGSINRARKPVYAQSQRFRAEQNGLELAKSESNA